MGSPLKSTSQLSYEFESKDYQGTPESPWNYAIHLDSDPRKIDMEVTVDGLKPPFPPFSYIAGGSNQDIYKQW